MGRESSVGIATRYCCTVRGWNPRRDFPYPSRPALEPNNPLVCNGHQVPFPGLKQPGRGINPTPSGAEVEKKSRAIHILPLCVFMAGFRVKYTFYIIIFVQPSSCNVNK
jgi:hypothetical protein